MAYQITTITYLVAQIKSKDADISCLMEAKAQGFRNLG